MPKAVLSNRIYMEASPELIQEVKDKLTYTIPAKMYGMPDTTMRTVGMLKPGVVTMPIGRQDLIPEGYNIVEKRILHPVEFPEFRGTLRDSQQDIYDELDSNALINAFVSFGKTYTALAIAGKLGQQTLAVMHNTSLRDQWSKEIEKMYGFTPDIIGSGKFGVSTPIVVSNVQTLRTRMKDVYKQFGTMIVDEVHKTPSTTFSGILDASAATYKIGLSGTLKRKDGKHVVLKDYFGPKIFVPPRENYMDPVIHRYTPNIRFSDSSADWATKVTQLLTDETYIKYIALLAATYAAAGHRVLVVADRVEFLKAGAELTSPRAISITGVDALEDRADLLASIASGDKSILWGTQSIFCEGISESSLSCLILATPLNNDPLLIQLVGRVIREQEGKQQPVVCDVKLLGSTATRQARNRVNVYISEGWSIEQH